MMDRRYEPGPLSNAAVIEIDQLIDAGQYARAAELAVRLRERTSHNGWRRRYHGLFLFAASRLGERTA